LLVDCRAGRAAKVINYFSAVCCTKFSVTTPSCGTFSRARGVFIFVRNFSRGIFLGKSLSKVATAAALSCCYFRYKSPYDNYYPFFLKQCKMRNFSPSYSIFCTPTTSPEIHILVNRYLSAKRKGYNHGANFQHFFLSFWPCIFFNLFFLIKITKGVSAVFSVPHA
jgi:hypothetical protein